MPEWEDKLKTYIADRLTERIAILTPMATNNFETKERILKAVFFAILRGYMQTGAIRGARIDEITEHPEAELIFVRIFIVPDFSGTRYVLDLAITQPWFQLYKPPKKEEWEPEEFVYNELERFELMVNENTSNAEEHESEDGTDPSKHDEQGDLPEDMSLDRFRLLC